MRALRLFTFAMLATAAWADSVDIHPLVGSLGYPLFGDVNGFDYSDNWGQMVYKTSPYFVGADPVFGEIRSGPLIATGVDTFTFDGGTFNFTHTFGTTYVYFPPPMPVCEDVGLVTDIFVSQCSIPGSIDIDGRFTGPLIVSISLPGSYEIDISGPVAFDLGAGLARAMGVSTGPYAGNLLARFLTVSFDPDFPEHLFDGNPDDSPQLDGVTFELTGFSVPEPSSLLLLATVALIGGLTRRMRRDL